jgi:hypothetical protein
MRPYDKRLLEVIRTIENPTLGQTLARACLSANIPVTHVAHALEVTRMTIHTWYRGGEIRGNNKKMINLFMDYVSRDTSSGRLPAKDLEDATKYIEELTGVRMK